MRICVIGDIFGRPGRAMIREYLPALKQKYQLDLVIANGENSAHGKGITTKIYYELIGYGIDVITTGNHFLAAREKKHDLFNSADRLVRPANIDDKADGVGSIVINVKGQPVRISNLLGRFSMNELMPTNPFIKLQEIIDSSQKMIHIVDFHAEATAEKAALAWYFDGVVTAVLGTHTHVQTNDCRVLPQGTGFISDLGMTGPFNSVIGCAIEVGIAKSMSALPTKFEVAEGDGQLSAVIIEVDSDSLKTKSIKAILLSPNNNYEL